MNFRLKYHSFTAERILSLKKVFQTMKRFVKKVLKKPSELYQKVMLGFGVVFCSNSVLMATVDPMTGITSVQSVMLRAIGIVALIVGGILVVKGMADVWKITNDVKTGQKEVWSYLTPVIMLLVAAGMLYLGSKLGFNVSAES